MNLMFVTSEDAAQLKGKHTLYGVDPFASIDSVSYCMLQIIATEYDTEDFIASLTQEQFDMLGIAGMDNNFFIKTGANKTEYILTLGQKFISAVIALYKFYKQDKFDMVVTSDTFTTAAFEYFLSKCDGVMYVVPTAYADKNGLAEIDINKAGLSQLGHKTNEDFVAYHENVATVNSHAMSKFRVTKAADTVICSNSAEYLGMEVILPVNQILHIDGDSEPRQLVPKHTGWMVKVRPGASLPDAYFLSKRKVLKIADGLFFRMDFDSIVMTEIESLSTLLTNIYKSSGSYGDGLYYVYPEYLTADKMFTEGFVIELYEHASPQITFYELTEGASVFQKKTLNCSNLSMDLVLPKFL